MTERVTAAEYQVLTGQAKPKGEPRIRSQRTTVGDEVFQSKREAFRWLELVMERKHGRITKLRRQVPFSLAVNRIHVCVYKADFVYERDGVETVEDAKGHRTEVYII